MILSNKYVQWIVNIAAKITPGTDAITIWPFIFVRPELLSDKRLIKHEKTHLKQYLRLGVIGFVPVYIYYHIREMLRYGFSSGFKVAMRQGYWNNPLEVEARLSEI